MNYNNSGMSVMEMSHRSQEFNKIIGQTESRLREIMAIRDNYHVLFLQGGASTQFAMVPLNLLKGNKKADYIKTGSFASKAIAEAKHYAKINVVASSEDKYYSYIPEIDKNKCDPKASYLHFTHNNTIYGTRFSELPDSGTVPLVTDMSSSFLSEEIDVSRFGLIYAGAQKNLGPAGVTIVIIRENLIGHAMDITPTMLNYKTHADNKSLYNTPPCYSIYICGLVLNWIKENGGIKAIENNNKQKAAMLYDYLDNSRLFKATANKKDRSFMNVTFVLPSDELTKVFIQQAGAVGLVNLKGHRSVGGIRISMYNAMPLAGVKTLVNFMNKFEREHENV